MIQFTGLEEAKHSKTHQKVCLYTIFTYNINYVLFFFLNSCVLVFVSEYMVSSQQGPRFQWWIQLAYSCRFSGSKAAPGCQTKKRREQLMSLGISGCRRQASSSLVPQLVFFFFRKTGNNPVMENMGEFTLGSFTCLYIFFSSFGCFSWCVAALFRLVQNASVRAEVVQGGQATREEIGNAFSCLVLLRNPSGIHHPKDIRFFETNQVQCIHMNLVHKVSLDTWRNTPTFGQSFPFTLKP